MENLISLVNKIQRACTALGDYGEGSAFVVAIAIAVGGQVNSRSLTFLPLRLIHAYELWLCFQSLCSLDLDLNRVFARFLGRNRLGNRHTHFRRSSPIRTYPKYRIFSIISRYYRYYRKYRDILSKTCLDSN